MRKLEGRPPHLSIEQILAWADEWFARTGRWPNVGSGVIPGSPDENWWNINAALGIGRRGLPGGSSLAQLLAEKRGVRNQKALPALTEEQILAWADEWFARTGCWPIAASGAIPGSPGENWSKINAALGIGRRGLPGGSSLPQLLAQKRGKRNSLRQPALTEEQILAWADEWFARTGCWPIAASGAIPGSSGENWSKINAALFGGGRGLSGGSSLAQLLAEKRGKRSHLRPPALTEEQILAWADEWLARTGRWPIAESGAIPGSSGENWCNINSALFYGFRGLPGGSSLAQLLAEKRGKRYQIRPPALTEEQILAWADEWLARTGRWPNIISGAIPGAPDENWSKINNALRVGFRGLPGGSSLAQLLAEKRGKRYQIRPSALTEEQILAWADEWFARTGRWPSTDSGVIPGSPNENWSKINNVLRVGFRGLPGGSSLAQLLAEKRGKRYRMRQLVLTEEQILAWADEWFARTGLWPSTDSGVIPDAPDENWSKINAALGIGCRGLPGGSSLAQLLAEKRGKRYRMRQLVLTEEQILAWADEWFARTGCWPKAASGVIPDAPDENWSKINAALGIGFRGLPGASSLAQLLAEKRGVRNQKALPALTEEQILAWADEWFARTGRWPKAASGVIPGSSGENWSKINNVLRVGCRGLPGGSSLAQLLAEKRGVRNQKGPPALTEEQILAWADAHFQRTGRWPKVSSGSIAEAPGETWLTVATALAQGSRGLPGGSTLAQLLQSKRGLHNKSGLPD